MKSQPFFYVLHLSILLVLSARYSIATTMMCEKAEYTSNITFTIPINIMFSGNPFFITDRESLAKKYTNLYLDRRQQQFTLLALETFLETFKEREIIERGWRVK